MFCSCRQSPMRALLASMAQLHVSEPATTRLPQRIGRNLPMNPIAPRSPFTTTSAMRRKDKPSKPITAAAAGDARPWQSQGTEEERREEARRRRRELHNNQEHWKIQKEALKQKFPEGWRPRKRLSPDAVAGIKALHAQFPAEYTTAKLAATFEMSPEAIRRILRAKWQASPEEDQNRQERWFRRGVSVWSRYAEMGVKPPQKWRREGVARDKSYHERRRAAIEKRKEEEARENKGDKLQRKLGGTIM